MNNKLFIEDQNWLEKESFVLKYMKISMCIKARSSALLSYKSLSK